jgi:hypothetical protein
MKQLIYEMDLLPETIWYYCGCLAIMQKKSHLSQSHRYVMIFKIKFCWFGILPFLPRMVKYLPCLDIKSNYGMKVSLAQRKAKMSFLKFGGEQGSCFTYISLPKSLALWISFTQGSLIRILRDKLRDETIHKIIGEHGEMSLTHLAFALPNVQDYHVRSKIQELECVQILW